MMGKLTRTGRTAVIEVSGGNARMNRYRSQLGNGALQACRTRRLGRIRGVSNMQLDTRFTNRLARSINDLCIYVGVGIGPEASRYDGYNNSSMTPGSPSAQHPKGQIGDGFPH